MEEKEKKERTVIHVQINEEHHYFGSIANIYEFFTSEQVGITYGALRNYGLNFDKPYQNSKCIIRKGILLAKREIGGKKDNVKTFRQLTITRISIFHFLPKHWIITIQFYPLFLTIIFFI